MKPLNFNTGNESKFLNAQQVCAQYGIEVVQQTYAVDEIQGEPEEVARDKADNAFRQAQEPVVVTDDSWDIPGLGGFPGVYMQPMNEWFPPEVFLRLTLPLDDRRVILTQYLIYTSSMG